MHNEKCLIHLEWREYIGQLAWQFLMWMLGNRALSQLSTRLRSSWIVCLIKSICLHSVIFLGEVAQKSIAPTVEEIVVVLLKRPKRTSLVKLH